MRIEGFSEFETKIKALPKKIQVKADAIVFDAAKEWKQLAQRAAPTDQGKLVGGITAEKVGLGIAEVQSQALYSPFIEWGTKTKFNPGEWSSYAKSLEYQKSGDYYDFLNAILDWVKRKGIGATYSTGIVKTRGGGYAYDMNKLSPRRKRVSVDKFLALAEAIAFSIIRKGINPHPFFFPPMPLIENKVKGRLKDLF